MQVFYVNIGGGEPTVRRDFWELLDYATAHDVGVKFSTNGSRITAESAARLAASDYVDVQISLDGATAAVNDAVRGPGSYATATAALEHLAEAGMRELQDLGGRDAQQRRPARRVQGARRPLRRAAAADAAAAVRARRGRLGGAASDGSRSSASSTTGCSPRGEKVLTGDSFFHLAAYGEPLPGLNLCGAGRVVCLIDPIGDVYACPFAIHEAFRAGNMRDDGRLHGDLARVGAVPGPAPAPDGGACASCSHFDSCRGGCMAAKFFTGLPLDGPDPECVLGHGESLLSSCPSGRVPRPTADHSRRPPRRPISPCEPSPLAGFEVRL